MESEIASNGTKVGEDVSKLQLGHSENVVLIATETGRTEPTKWLDFLGKCLREVTGNVFLATVPNCAKSSKMVDVWLNQDVPLKLFRCNINGSGPEQIALIRATKPLQAISLMTVRAASGVTY